MTEYLPLTLEEIKTDLETFVKDNLGLSDADYQGSNTSLIVQLLAYNTLQLNRSMTFGFSEMFLNTAEIRRNVVRLARNYGYNPKRKTSYQYRIRLESNKTGDVTLPRFSTFTDGTNTYTYVGNDITKTYGNLLEFTLLDDTSDTSFGMTGQDFFDSIVAKTTETSGTYVYSDTGAILEVLKKTNETEQKSILVDVLDGELTQYGGNTSLLINDSGTYRQIAKIVSYTVDYTDYENPLMYIFIDNINSDYFPYVDGDNDEDTINVTKFFTNDCRPEFLSFEYFTGFKIKSYIESEGKLVLETLQNVYNETEVFNLITTNMLSRFSLIDILEITSISLDSGVLTASFSAKDYAPFPIGTQITVAGILDADNNSIAGIDGSVEVTACTVNSVSWLYTGLLGTENVDYFLVNPIVMDNDPGTDLHTKTFARCKSLTNINTLEVTVKEGNILGRQTVVVTNTLKELGYYPIESDEVEENGFFISVGRVNYNNEYELRVWNKRESFVTRGITSEERTYFVLQDEIYSTLYKIYTDFADSGIQLNVGDIFYIDTLKSVGASGEATALMTSNLEDFTVVPYVSTSTETINHILVIRGQDEETTEEIKASSAMFNNAAYRAITKNDFITVCNKQPLVEQTQVWGGEELVPTKNPGTVYFSFIPYSRNVDFVNYNNTKFYISGKTIKNVFQIPDTQILYTGDEDSIFNVLKDYKIMTLDLEKVEPLYLDIDLEVTMAYKYIDKTISELNNSIFTLLKNYFKNYLEFFEADIFHSTLVKLIDAEIGGTAGATLNMIYGYYLQYFNFTKISETELDSDTIYNYRLDLTLDFPYENMFEDDIYSILGTTYGKFISSRIPLIDTSNFITYGDSIYVDTSSISAIDVRGKVLDTVTSEATEIYMKIMYKLTSTSEAIEVGTYTIYNSSDKKFIDVKLYSNLNYTSGTKMDGLNYSDFYGAKKLYLTLNNQNISTIRNTFPRLNSVLFKG